MEKLMTRITKSALNKAMAPAVMAALVLAGCGGADEPATLSADDKARKTTSTPTSPGAPAKISHAIVGTPVIGQPLQVDLSFESMSGVVPMIVDFRINDSTAMIFPDQQVRSATITPDSGSLLATQQVTIIPQREGRLYLNVSIAVESDTGMSSTVMAIPIQVGEGPRAFTENGRLSTDANGNAIRVLPASRD